MATLSVPLTLGEAGTGNLGVADSGSLTTAGATLGHMANSEGNADVEAGGIWNVNGNLVIGDHGTGFVYLRQDGDISLASGKQVLLGNMPMARVCSICTAMVR